MTKPSWRRDEGGETPASTKALLQTLWAHVSPRRRRQIGLLCMLMALGALAEMISLGAILPLLSVLAEPEKAFQLRLVGSLSRMLGSTRGQMNYFYHLHSSSPWRHCSPVACACCCCGLTLACRASSAMISVSKSTGGRFISPTGVHTSRNTSYVISGVNKARAAIGVMGALLGMATGH